MKVRENWELVIPPFRAVWYHKPLCQIKEKPPVELVASKLERKFNV